MLGAKFLTIVQTALVHDPESEVNADHEAFYFGGPAPDSEAANKLREYGALWSADYDCWMVFL